MIQIILLIIGFYILIKGADIFVDGASNISKKIGIPSIIVGLTIVSIGTSAPELAVSITSALKGSTDMAIGNVLGSNLFNILVVLGAIALISPVLIKKKDVLRDYLVTVVSTIILIVLGFAVSSSGESNTISRLEGIILVALCIMYVVWLIAVSVKNKSSDISEDGIDREDIKILNNLFKIVLGIACIVIGGDMAVENAKHIAVVGLGMSEKLCGLTIIAIGTSLPELITSVVATRKGENEIALGNILGSCIFNILLIIGVSSSISPIVASGILIIDFIFLLMVLLSLGLIIYANKKKDVLFTKAMGVSYIAMYVAYTIYIVLRN